MSDQYAAIAAHRTELPVTLMCRVLDVSCAGFYAAQRRLPSARAQADKPLRVHIRTAFGQSRKRFGAPRIIRVLRTPRVRVSTKRIARLMQADGWQGRPPRRFVRTTQRNPADRVAPNLLHRDFAVRATRPLNTVWVSDVTFIPTRMGWLYLAIVLDLASRRVVGWATSAHNDTALVLAALQRTPGPCVSHPRAGGTTRTKAARIRVTTTARRSRTRTASRACVGGAIVGTTRPRKVFSRRLSGNGWTTRTLPHTRPVMARWFHLSTRGTITNDYLPV